MNLNQLIRQTACTILSNSKRPVESRKFAKLISVRFKTSVFRVFGNISYLEKTGNLRFVVKKKGGPSYLV